MSSISELYSFMDASDATLARKVLGEGGPEEAEGEDAAAATEEEGETAGFGAHTVHSTLGSPCRDICQRSLRAVAMHI